MSVLPAQVHAALSQLLQALSSADNNARSQAEEQLNTEWVAGRSGVLLMGLVEQIQGSEEPSVRINMPDWCCVVTNGSLTETLCSAHRADSVVCSSPLPTDSYQDAQTSGHGRVKGVVPNFTRSGEDCDQAEAAAMLRE